MTRGRQISRNMLFSLITLAMVLGSMEGIARMFPPVSGMLRYGRLIEDNYGIFVEDPVLMLRVRPNMTREKDKVITNSGGFRGGEFPLKKKPGEFRILCLGDSTTWGWGVWENQTYCSVIGEALKETASVPVSALNGGVPAYTSFQGYWLFRTELKKYRPDLVITYFGNNDRFVNVNGKPPDTDWRVPGPAAAAAMKLLHRSRLYSNVRKLVFKYRDTRADAEAGGTRLAAQRVSLEDYRIYMGKTAAEAAGIGAVTLNVISVMNFGGGPRNDVAGFTLKDGKARVKYSGRGPVYKVEPSFDSAEVFREAGMGTEDIFLPMGDGFYDYCHLSPKGHYVLGRALARRILSDAEFGKILRKNPGREPVPEAVPR